MVDVRWFSGVTMLVACTLGCGGESEGAGEGDSGGGTSGGGTSGGGTSGGGTSGGGTSGGGTSGGGTSGGGTSGGGTSGGGTSGGGTSGGGGAGAVDCSGAFGAPRTVLEVPDFSFSGLTLSPDELELIYSAGSTTTGTLQNFFSARRASKADAFSNPVALPELDRACTTPDETRSGDLTYDGLRFYFTCYSNADTASTPLRVARRASLDAPFVVDPMPLGTLRGGPSVSRDELELFSAVSDVPAMRLVRSDRTEPFGTPELVAGFEMLTLATPEIAPNGLDIFVSQTTTGSSFALTTATRSGPGAAFGPLELVLPESPNEIFGSPAISNDCRSLYYVYVSTMPLLYRVDVITR